MSTDNGREFSHVIELDHSVHHQAVYKIKATSDECYALCQRFSIEDIKNLEVTLEIEKSSFELHNFVINGHLVADIIQQSIISLNKVEDHIDITFCVHVINHKDQNIISDEGEEDIEYATDGKIDIGEISAQYLSVSINPYPKTPEEKLGIVQESTQESPFAILKSFKG